MKKILSTLALISILAVPMMILAEEQQEIPAAPFDSPSSLLDTVNNIGTWIFTALLILAGIFMVVAGFYFVTGGGEPEKLNKARQMLINALIGVAVGLASKGLIEVVKALVKGQ